MCRDCLLHSAFKNSGSKSRDGQRGPQHPRDHLRRTNGFTRGASGHRHPLPVREGKGRSRGKLGHTAWVGEWIVKEPERPYLSVRGAERSHRQHRAGEQRQFQQQCAWTAKYTLHPSILQIELTFLHPPWFSSGPSSELNTKMSMSSVKCESCTGVTARDRHHQR